MSDELDRVRGYVAQTLPNANADGTSVWLRLARNGEIIVKNSSESFQQQADEGSYFVATNPTIGTAVATAVNASYDITKGHFVIFNNNTTASGIRCYPDYIKMIPTVAPASGTNAMYALQLDNTNRYSAGGAVGTVKNVNMDNTTKTSSTSVYAPTGGTIITVGTATSAARIVGRGVLRSVIPAVNDAMILKFGYGNNISSATAAGTTVAVAPPIVVGPQQSLVVIIWYASNASTGISFEFEVGFTEK
jgi:hypothetical protein